MRLEVDSMVWVKCSDLTEQQFANIRRMLTIQPRRTSPMGDDPEPIKLWEHDRAREAVGLPREFYRNHAANKHDEVVQVSDGDPFDVPTLMRFEGSFVEQAEALDALAAHDAGCEYGGQLLEAKCGFGKTNVGLEYARRRGRRTLILVHKSALARQWRERIEEFMPEATVGMVKGSKCEWDRNFVIATVQTLVRFIQARAEGKSRRGFPDDLLDKFGTVLVDECHRIGAASWSEVMKHVTARYRLGLSATLRRKDGAEDVFRQHLGRVTYKAKTQMVTPLLRRIVTDVELVKGKKWTKDDDNEWVSEDVEPDNLSLSQAEQQLYAHPGRNRAIVDTVAEAVRGGRKVLLISSRIDHLWTLAGEIEVHAPGTSVDFYTGSWYVFDEDGKRVSKGRGRGKGFKTRVRKESELHRAESAQVVLCTKQMVEEGLDIPAVDVLVLACPMSDVEQAVGRCQRACLPSKAKCGRMCEWRSGVCEGKPVPVVVDVHDEWVSQVSGRWRGRSRFYQSIGTKID